MKVTDRLHQLEKQAQGETESKEQQGHATPNQRKSSLRSVLL